MQERTRKKEMKELVKRERQKKRVEKKSGQRSNLGETICVYWVLLKHDDDVTRNEDNTLARPTQLQSPG